MLLTLNNIVHSFEIKFITNKVYKMKANFKDKLKEKRKVYTQKGLADKIGISQSYFSLIQSGQRVPPLNLKKKIERELAKI